jgi:hypothetical protein
MMKKRKKSLGPLVSPQAIMWRPIRYFSDVILDDEDELDHFKFVGYTENNTPFDIRAYLGHPPETVTLYLPSDISQDDAIQEQIETAIRALDIPESALAWRRGQQIQYGQLKRHPRDRLREREARVLVLKIISTFSDHQASTGKIKDRVPDFYDLSSEDLAPSPTRRREAMWRQIIGNVKVHHKGSKSIFTQGLAEIVPGGIKLTDKGYDYLKSIGFAS